MPQLWEKVAVSTAVFHSLQINYDVDKILKIPLYLMFRYNALDALRLISMDDEYFHCENCNGELVAESDKLAAEEGGDGDDNARRRRREKLKDMLQNLEVSFLLCFNCTHHY